jgi:hypothetical protein
VNSLQASRWPSRRTGGGRAALALPIVTAVTAMAVMAATAVIAASAGPAEAAVAARATPAGTAGAPVAGPFGLTPTPTRAGQPRPYFILTLAPGRSAWESAVIGNEGTRTERLRVTTSRGVTAANSGSAFEGTGRWCAGAGCWVSGLPATVTLAPGARKLLTFRVSVPRWTRPGQYLAGITAESAIRPRPVRVGWNGRASAQAIIIDQVTVGVAVTVGPLWRLRPGLAIWRVSAGWIGPTPRLYIPVRNTGRTFVRATGAISCRSGGRWHAYRVIMDTVLPGGNAVLPINAPGLSSGALPCAVRLDDGARTPVTWYGIVRLAAQVATTTYHPVKGVYVSLPESSVPPWAIALMVIGALIVAILLALLVQSRRRLARPAAGGPAARRRAARRPAARPAAGPARRRVVAMTWRPRRS